MVHAAILELDRTGASLSPQPALPSMASSPPVPEGILMAQVGDQVVVEAPVVDSGRRHGEILAVLGNPDTPRYRVRWSNGAESVFCPGPDARIESRPTRPEPGAPSTGPTGSTLSRAPAPRVQDHAHVVGQAGVEPAT